MVFSNIKANVAFRNQIPKQIKDDRYENKNRKWIQIEQYYFYRCVKPIIAKREKCMKISTEKMKKTKKYIHKIKQNKEKWIFTEIISSSIFS